MAPARPASVTARRIRRSSGLWATSAHDHRPTRRSRGASHTPRLPVRRPMSARQIDEPHRVSSQLELLFDLTFVVGIASITAAGVPAATDRGDFRTITVGYLIM